MKARRHTRLEHLTWLEGAVERGAWTGLKDRLLLLVLWELPTPRQLALPRALARQSLPRFEARHPQIGALGAWLNAASEGRAPTMPEVADLRPVLDAGAPDDADLFLYSAVARMCEGAAPGAAPETITSAAVSATRQAIGALAAQAWIHDDPEAAAAKRQFLERLKARSSPLEPSPAPPRPMQRNAVALEAEDSAWQFAVTWLRAADLGQYPEVVGRGALAHAVRRSYGDFVTVLYPGEIFRAPPSPARLRGRSE